MQANALSFLEARQPTRVHAVQDWGSQQRSLGRWGKVILLSSSSSSIVAYTGVSLCLGKLKCLPASLNKSFVQVVVFPSMIPANRTTEDGE